MSDRAPVTFRLFANFGLLSVAELVSKLLGAVAFAVLARVLGPEQYGYLEFTLAVIFFFALFVDSGLSTYGAREIARDPTAVGRLASRIVATRLLLAAVCLAFLLLLAGMFQPPVQTLLMFYGLTLFGIPFLLQWIFQGREMMHYVAIANVARWLTFTLAVLLLVNGPGRLLWVALAEALAVSVAGAFYLTAVSMRFDNPWRRFELRPAVSSWVEALPIGGSELVWALKVYFATILLGLLYDGSAVAWFGGAHRIVLALHAFVWLYFFNLLPAIARCSKGPTATLRRLLSSSMRITFPRYCHSQSPLPELPCMVGAGHAPGLVLRGAPHARLTALSEEHGWVQVRGGGTYSVGDRVRVVPNHACVAVNTQDEIYLVDGDEVVHGWPVDARGRVQ